MDKATRAALEAVRDRYLELTVGEVMAMPKAAKGVVLLAIAEGSPDFGVATACMILAEVEA